MTFNNNWIFTTYYPRHEIGTNESDIFPEKCTQVRWMLYNLYNKNKHVTEIIDTTWPLLIIAFIYRFICLL